MNTTTEGDALPDALEPVPDGSLPLLEPVPGTAGRVVSEPGWPPLPEPDVPYGVTWGPDVGEPGDSGPDGVMVKTVVRPEGNPGPAGTV